MALPSKSHCTKSFCEIPLSARKACASCPGRAHGPARQAQRGKGSPAVSLTCGGSDGNDLSLISAHRRAADLMTKPRLPAVTLCRASYRSRCVWRAIGCRLALAKCKLLQLSSPSLRLAWAAASVAATMVRAKRRHGFVFVQGARGE